MTTIFLNDKSVRMSDPRSWYLGSGQVTIIKADKNKPVLKSYNRLVHLRKRGPFLPTDKYDTLVFNVHKPFFCSSPFFSSFLASSSFSFIIASSPSSSFFPSFHFCFLLLFFLSNAAAVVLTTLVALAIAFASSLATLITTLDDAKAVICYCFSIFLWLRSFSAFNFLGVVLHNETTNLSQQICNWIPLVEKIYVNIWSCLGFLSCWFFWQ